MDRGLFRSYLKLIAYAILMVAAVVKADLLLSFASRFLSILSPLFIGIALAFIINGPFEWLNRLLIKFPPLSGNDKGRRFIAVLLSHVFFLVLVTVLFYFIVPQFIDSVKQFSASYPTYRDQVNAYIKVVADYLKIQSVDLSSFDDFIKQLPDRLSTFLTGFVPKLFTITTGVVRSIINVLLGFVLSIYILSDKRKLEDILLRTIRAYLPSRAKRIEQVGELTASTFKKFVYGQLTEALILSLACFAGMLVFGFPYALPISMIIGVSNLIPIAGPIIGTIPSVLIILLVDPVKALWFVLFIVVLQQVEGNFIYPRVVGSTIGLPPLWLLMVIIVGGGLFGVIGMVLGVPTVTVLYKLLNEDLDRRLRP